MQIINILQVSFGYWKQYFMFAVLLFLNGTFQATAWPNCVKSLSSWYSDEHAASIFGLWGTCIFAGGIIGTSLAVYSQSIYSPNLEMVFIVPSLVVFLIGILVFFSLKTPADLNLNISGGNQLIHVTNGSDQNKRNLSVLDICQLKTVPELLVSVICLKLVRYCLYMLPYIMYPCSQNFVIHITPSIHAVQLTEVNQNIEICQCLPIILFANN